MQHHETPSQDKEEAEKKIELVKKYEDVLRKRERSIITKNINEKGTALNLQSCNEPTTNSRMSRWWGAFESDSSKNYLACTFRELKLRVKKHHKLGRRFTTNSCTRVDSPHVDLHAWLFILS